MRILLILSEIRLMRIAQKRKKNFEKWEGHDGGMDGGMGGIFFWAYQKADFIKISEVLEKGVTAPYVFQFAGIENKGRN